VLTIAKNAMLRAGSPDPSLAKKSWSGLTALDLMTKHLKERSGAEDCCIIAKVTITVLGILVADELSTEDLASVARAPVLILPCQRARTVWPAAARMRLISLPTWE